MIKKALEIKKFIQAGKKVGCEANAALTCLGYKDGDFFIAHCLEFDLVAQGDTMADARAALADLIKSHIQFAIEKDVEDKSLFHPAPQKYWDILRQMRTRLARQELVTSRVPSTRSILNSMSCTYAHI